MDHILQLIFNPPPLPPIELPELIPTRMKMGVMQMILDAFKLAYYRGVFDGLLVGVIIDELLSSIRRRRD